MRNEDGDIFFYIRHCFTKFILYAGGFSVLMCSIHENTILK